MNLMAVWQGMHAAHESECTWRSFLYRWGQCMNDKLDRSYKCKAEIPTLVHGVWSFVSVCCPAPRSMYMLWNLLTCNYGFVLLCNSILSSKWQSWTSIIFREFTNTMRSMSEVLDQICTNSTSCVICRSSPLPCHSIPHVTVTWPTAISSDCGCIVQVQIRLVLLFHFCRFTVKLQIGGPCS